jgi:CTP synthase (UTP-ammonia lyase)
MISSKRGGMTCARSYGDAAGTPAACAKSARCPVRLAANVLRDMTTITVLGDHNDDWVTHRALDAALTQLPEGVHARWAATDAPLDDLGDGLWVAPGSPYRDDEAVMAAIARARREGVPLLGTCGGFQYIWLSLAGRDLGDHAESTPDATAPLLAPLPCRVDGEWRPVTPVADTQLAELLGAAPFAGLFFCGYAPRPDAAELIAAAGARVAAHADGIGPVALEVPDGDAFVMATLFHVQIGALDGEPLSPVIEAFAQAAQARARVVTPTR